MFRVAAKEKWLSASVSDLKLFLRKNDCYINRKERSTIELNLYDVFKHAVDRDNKEIIEFFANRLPVDFKKFGEDLISRSESFERAYRAGSTRSLLLLIDYACLEVIFNWNVELTFNFLDVSLGGKSTIENICTLLAFDHSLVDFLAQKIVAGENVDLAIIYAIEVRFDDLLMMMARKESDAEGPLRACKPEFR